MYSTELLLLSNGIWVSLSRIPVSQVEHTDNYRTYDGWNKHTDKEPDSPHIGSLNTSFSTIKIYPSSTKEAEKNC